jgi:hypothetical protein
MATPQEVLMGSVSGNPATSGTMNASVAIYRSAANKRTLPATADDKGSIAEEWQIEAYRHVNICGEARYAATLFASIAGRAEIGISEPQALARKASWVDNDKAPAEIEALAELAPTVRERTKLIRDYMLHRTIAGECYLIARKRREHDPDPDSGEPIWEIVAVTELRKRGSGENEVWEVRYENGNYVPLDPREPIIRIWSPDPADRRKAWSPFRSMLPTLKEIEWATAHIFRQIRSRLMSAGVWFVPNNITFPPPPSEALGEGAAEKIAAMNEAEQFMVSLAASGMQELDPDEVAFPTIVMADPAALEAVDQKKLIQFWSEIDDKVMAMRSSAVRRFALGMDLPPEQILGSSGLAVDGSGGSAGSVNHWGVWANEEQTISSHVEPALDDLVGVLTYAYLRVAVPGTTKVVAYDTAGLRLRQDRSKEAIQLYGLGLLKGEVTLREVGFDPENDKMTDEEFKKWLLTKIALGAATPEQVAAANIMLGVDLPMPAPVSQPSQETAPGAPGRALPPNLDSIPVEGPPTQQHDHSDAPYSTLVASCEVLVLRALEKAGHRLLNDGKRGKDRDRTTPAHLAYVTAGALPALNPSDFDFSLAHTALDGLQAARIEETVRRMGLFCWSLYTNKDPYNRTELMKALEGV